MNIPAFLRSLVRNVRDEHDRLIFDYFELDQIVEAATSSKIPQITAKKWAITNHKKGIVFEGKNFDDQAEIASLTKVCTAFTVCRILEEMGIYGIEQSKNYYLRVSRKAAFMIGTSAYV